MDTIKLRTNFARIGDIVIEIFGKGLRDELSSKVPPTELKERLEEISHKKYKRHIKTEKEKVIDNAVAKNSYSEIDLSLLFILVRNLCFPTKLTSNASDRKFLTGIKIMETIRNNFAHSATNKIEDSAFESIMEDCEDACKRMDERIGTTYFTKALIDISNRDVDTTSNERDEIFQDLQTKEDLVSDWEVDDRKFYETSGCRFAERFLQSRTIITIAGPSGFGKSAIAQHIALKYKTADWKIYPVNNIRELNHLINPLGQCKQVFVLHDPLGKDFTEEQLYKDWKNLESNLKVYLKTGRIKLILTCRVTVIDDLKEMDLLQESIVSLHEKFCLSRNEKLSILQKHYASCSELSEYELNQILTSQHYFPLLCAMFGQKKEYQQLGSMFFLKPTEIMQKEIADLMEHEDYKSCGLILLVSTNGCLNSDLSNIDENTFQKVIRIKKLSEDTTKVIIIKELQSLIGFLLRRKEDKFVFLHDFIGEVTTYVFGKSNDQDTFLDLCPTSALRKMVFFSGDSDRQREQDMMILLSDQQIDPMVDRYLKELENNFVEISLCPSFRYIKVQQEIAKKILFLNDNIFERLFLSPCKTSDFPKIAIEFFQEFTRNMLKISGERARKIDFLKQICEVVNDTERTLKRPFEEPLTRRKQLAVKHVLDILKSQPDDDFEDFDFPETRTNRGFHIEHTNQLFEHVFPSFVESLQTDYEFTDFFRHCPCPEECNKKVRKFFAKGMATLFALGPIQPILLEKLNCSIIKMARIFADDENIQRYLFPYDTSGRKLNLKCIELLFAECTEEEMIDVNCYCLRQIDSKKSSKITYEVYYFLSKALNIFTLESRQFLHSFIDDIVDFGNFLDNIHISEIKLALQEKGLADVSSKQSKPFLEALAGIRDLIPDSKKFSLQTKIVQLKHNMMFCAFENSLLLSCVIHDNIDIVKAVLPRAQKSLDASKTKLISKYLLLASCISGSVQMFQTVFDFVGKKTFSQRWYFKGGGFNALHISSALHYSDLTSLLLEKKFPVNSIDRSGSTALHLALKSFCRRMTESERRRGVETIKVLLRYGIDMSVRDMNGATPVHLACKYVSNADIFDRFMQYNQNINDSIDNGSSLLNLASIMGNLTIVQKLIELGANINHKNSRGLTPLHSACIAGCTDTINFLLSRGINKNDRDKLGLTPLMHAAKNGHYRTVTFLLDTKVNVDAVDDSCRTALFHATENNHFEVVEILCNHSANVHKSNSKCLSPFFLAAMNGNIRIAKTLCCCGADVNKCNSMKETPLMIASRNNHIELVEFLLEKSAEVNFTDSKLRNALFFSALHGNEEITELLLEYHSEINSCDENGITPHMIASINNKTKTLSLLLKWGCDIDYCSKTGDTALILASRAGLKNIACLLIENEANVNTCNQYQECALWVAAASGHTAIVRLLLEEDAEVNLFDAVGRTPLYMAAVNGHSSIVCLLLEYNACVDAATQSGDSPLMIASGIGKDDVVEILIDYDADINLKDRYGKTPLLFAVQGNHDTTVDLLLEICADVNLCDAENVSPLMLAIANRRTKIILQLLKYGAPFRVLIMICRRGVVFCFPSNKKVYLASPKKQN